jgi:cytochrome c
MGAGRQLSPKNMGAEELTMKYLPVLVLSAAAVLGAASVGRTQTVSPRQGWSLIEAEEIAGQELFKNHCAACHVPKANGHILAPSLRGVVGRPAGSVAGFPYSKALKNSGLTWTEDNLRKWISDNEHIVQGTLMPHVTIKDPAEMIYIVAYLKTQKAKP